MTLNEYQEKAQSFDLTKEDNFRHQKQALFGLCEEVGELMGKFKRAARGDYGTDGCAAMNMDNDVMLELGDVLWYVAAVAASARWNLEDIASSNIAKLEARKAKGVIKGSGER